MIRAGTSRSISTIAAVAFAGIAAAFLTPNPPAARADPQSASLSQQVGVKGDRLPVRVIAPDCAAQSWPNHPAGCHFDLRPSTGEARKIRVVSLERVSARVGATQAVSAVR